MNMGILSRRRKIVLTKSGTVCTMWTLFFRKLPTTKKIGRISRELGLQKPLAAQSMYIFKQPRIGGKVDAHQDGTFLYTSPQSVVGFWWALEDTSLENGCLWAVPGSHLTTPITRRFKRDGKGGVVFEPLPPQQYNLTGAFPLILPRGSLVILHSGLVHFSLENRSNRSRHAYTLHAVEGNERTVYPSDNWLQRPPQNPFNILPD